MAMFTKRVHAMALSRTIEDRRSFGELSKLVEDEFLAPCISTDPIWDRLLYFNELHRLYLF